MTHSSSRRSITKVMRTGVVVAVPPAETAKSASAATHATEPAADTGVRPYVRVAASVLDQSLMALAWMSATPTTRSAPGLYMTTSGSGPNTDVSIAASRVTYT